MSAYREDAIVRASYVLEADDVNRAHAALLLRNHRFAALSVAVTVLGIAVLYLIAFSPSLAFVMTLVVAAPVGWFFQRSFGSADVAEAYGEAWEDRRHVELEVTEDELVVSDRLTSSRLAWEVVLHWRELDDAFHIYTSAERFHVVPKRAFATQEMLTTLRRLLSDRVAPGAEGAIARMKRAVWVPTAAYWVTATLVLGSLIELLGRFV